MVSYAPLSSHLVRLGLTPAYSPQIGVFADGKVEVMLKLTPAQAKKLARLLAELKLGYANTALIRRRLLIFRSLADNS